MAFIRRHPFLFLNLRKFILSTNRRTKASRLAQNASQKRPAFTLKNIQPQTVAQEELVESYLQGRHIVGYGSAGTGKSFLALYLALNDVLDGRKSEIRIVRSTVPTRDQGFLPGTLEEKEAVYELPYRDIVNDLCSCGTAYEELKKKDKIKFMSTSYVRGMTFDDAVIIIDEFQNCTPDELYSVLTRVGRNTTVIVIGDTRQGDLNPRKEVSSFEWFMNLADKMDEDFDIIEFMPEDIVRSGFVKRLIIANEK